MRGIRPLIYVSLLASVCMWQGAGACASDTHAGDALPEQNIRAVQAKPPKPVYFDGEILGENDLNKITPRSGDAGDPDSVRTGADKKNHPMSLEANPAYPGDAAILEAAGMRSDADSILPGEVVLEPKAAWLVGPSQASRFSKGDAHGCLALNQFSNGFIVGIHGREGEIIGLTIDTRQPDFVPEQVYPVALGLGNDSHAIMGFASDATTLALDLEGVIGFRKRVSEVGFMRVMVDQRSVFLSTVGLYDGVKRLGKCLNERRTKTMKVENTLSGEDVIRNVDANANDDLPTRSFKSVKAAPIKRSGKDVPLALAMTEMVPSGYRFIIERGINPMDRISWNKGAQWTDVMDEALKPYGLHVHVSGTLVRITREKLANSDHLKVLMPEPDATLELRDGSGATSADVVDHNATRVWTALEGERLDDVLSTWSSYTKVKLVVDLDGDFTLGQDFSYEGKLADAVDALMGEFEGMNSRPMSRFSDGGASKRAAGGPAEMYLGSDIIAHSDRIKRRAGRLERLGYLPSKNYIGRADTGTMSSHVWLGLESANLQDTLKKWCDDSQTELVWLSDQMFELKESVKMQGGFTDAVSGVLQQFSNDTIRPMAQLNNDPDTGKTTLIIRGVGLKPHKKPVKAK